MRCHPGRRALAQVEAKTGAGLLARIITRLMKMLTRLGYLIEEEGMTYIADMDADNPLASLQAASWPCRLRRASDPAPRQAQSVHRTA